MMILCIGPLPSPAQVLMQLEELIKETLFHNFIEANKVSAAVRERGIKSPKDFDIDLADWFDSLAGTSTGGLLALYRELSWRCLMTKEAPYASSIHYSSLYLSSYSPSRHLSSFCMYVNLRYLYTITAPGSYLLYVPDTYRTSDI